MAIGTMIVARDFFLAPEELASVHVNDKVKWPATIQLGQLFLAVGLIVAAGDLRRAGGARPRARQGRRPPTSRALRPFRRFLDRLVRRRRPLRAADRDRGAVRVRVLPRPGPGPDAVHPPVVQAGAGVVREVRAAPARRSASTASRDTARRFYSKQTMVDLPNQDRVVAVPARSRARVRDGPDRRSGGAGRRVQAGARPLLRRRRVVVALPAADQPARRAASATTTRWRTTSGCRPAGDPSAPQPPWTWRVPLSATFGDAIELVGADFPNRVRRPGKIPLDLYLPRQGEARRAATRSSCTSTARPRRA